jgi:UPF0176 protein
MSRERAREIEKELSLFSKKMRGLILLGVEGINATISGPEEVLTEFKATIENLFEAKIHFKNSLSDKEPFRTFKLRLRKEIVTLGRPDLIPDGDRRHLSPKEWHDVLSNEDVVVIDTRNTYETEIGKFKNAVDLRIEEFSEFPKTIKNLGLKKDQKVLMYCTGGIRCEKAILEMNEQGYENIFQLRGGILEYLKEFPNQHYDGECFVFDYRVAVDQNLKPSKRYNLCPHCGQPANQKIDCIRCETKVIVCKTCLDQSQEFATCSKNCAHHERVKSKSRKPNLHELAKRQPV